MSDTMNEGQPAEVTEAPLTGQADVAETGAATEAPQHDPADVLDPAEYGSKLVPITVDGKTDYVPYSEATQGFMRQADYTQKTQSIAAEREQLQQAQALARALEVDPQGTIKLIQEAYAESAPAPLPTTNEEGEPLSPLEQQVAQQQQWIQQFQQQQALTSVQAEMADLHQRYDGRFGAFDDMQLAQHAALNNFHSLEAAYRDLNWDRVAATEDWEKQRTDGEAVRSAAKGELAAVEHGTGVASAAVGVAPAKITSVAQAAKAAFAKLAS